MFIRDFAKEKCDFCVYKEDEDKCPSGNVTCKDGIKKWLEGSDWD